MNCPYCTKEFKSWISVRNHTRMCNKSNGEYIIDENEGSIHYTEFPKTFREVKLKFPNLNSSITVIKKSFKKRGIILNIDSQNYSKEEVINYIKLFVEKNNIVPNYTSWKNNPEYPGSKYVVTLFGSWNNAIETAEINFNHRRKQNYTKEEIINYIKLFYKKENRIPIGRDWKNKLEYPGSNYVMKLFGSWNNAIEAAGFDINNGSFGNSTIAKDNILYRSSAEAYFVNTFLYKKEIYKYETKYPEPHNKYYDFYLPERNLYIEIDGGLRPQVMQEKIKINEELDRNLLVIPTKDIYKFKGFK